MSSTYTQDVEFNSDFGAMQAPVHLFTVGIISNLLAPDISRPFRYLDLACGNGLTLALLADAYPHAEFVGVDINKNHIAKANARAKKSKLNNVKYIKADVLDIKAGDFQAFDYCAACGVYAWLDTTRRIAMRQFISSVVRPGGFVYLDYSSQPGMAQVAPLYKLLSELAKSFKGSSAQKLTQAARIADQMRENGAYFFQANPEAASRLQGILQSFPEDEAHEVFNLQGGGLWSADVISNMNESGFDFVGHAGLHHNLPNLSSQPDEMNKIRHMPDARAQTYFDAYLNVSNRRDIYVKQGAKKAAHDLIANLEDKFIYAMPKTLDIAYRNKLKKPFPHFDFCSHEASEFSKSVKDATTFGDVFNNMTAKDIPIKATRDIARHFLAVRLISLAVKPVAKNVDAGDFHMGSTYNQLTLTDDIGAEFAWPFASPVLGTRVLLPLKDRLYLWALTGQDLGKAWDNLGAQRDMLKGKDNKPVSRETFIQIIEYSLPMFCQHAVPELFRLGILAD